MDFASHDCYQMRWRAVPGLRDVAAGGLLDAVRQALVLIFFFLLAGIVAQAQTPLNTSSVGELNQPATVIERLRANNSDPTVLDEARAVGFGLLRVARYEDAANVFKAMLDAVPGEQSALYGDALALFNQRRLAEAEPLARASVETATASVATFAKRGDDLDRAKGRAADSLVLLAVILAVRGNNAGALASVTKAVALAPKNFDAQLALGRARVGNNDPAGATAAFRAAVALKPDDPRARFFLATALESAGDDGGALIAYRELIRVAPNVADGHLGLGVLLIKRGDNIDEGISALLQALAINGELYEARVVLARALIRVGRPADAVTHLQRAAALAPNNPEPHYQLAIAYRRLGRSSNAATESALVKKLHEARRVLNEKTSVNEPSRRPN